MCEARADHALYYHDDKIYALGGMRGRPDLVESLNTMEVYCLEKDKWT